MSKMFPTREELWFDSGKISERASIVKVLEDYLALTEMSVLDGAEPNSEWDAGFQAALALIKEKNQ